MLTGSDQDKRVTYPQDLINQVHSKLLNLKTHHHALAATHIDDIVQEFDRD